MKKILVILTGGTIGSRVEKGIINVSEDSSYRLIDDYVQNYGNPEWFEVIQPVSLLSENMSPDRWSELTNILSGIIFENYRGIIMTHGSDTLSYTSAMVGMLFHYASVPFILTASNYALGEQGSNGLINFKSAVDLINLNLLKGVFAVYQDDTGNNQVYLSTRILEAEPYKDQFGAFGGTPFGRMEKGKLIRDDSAYQPEFSEINKKKDRLFKYPVSFRDRILIIRPYPGLNYSRYDLREKPAAVLHYLYHSATACTQEGVYSMPDFAERCMEKGIDFYTASVKRTGGNRYQTTDRIKNAGITELFNISLEAAYARLMIAYNQTEKDRKETALQNLYFESLKAWDNL